MGKKQFFGLPEEIKDNELWGFNWLEYVTAIPQPLALVTGYKENGLANGTMQSWFCFSNENDFYCVFGDVNKYTHMYDIITKQKQLTINFPNKMSIGKCMDTIKNNDYDTDELKAVGLSYHNGSKTNSPIVEECFLNLECEFVWEKELFENSDRRVVCVKIVNIWFDEDHYDENKLGRYGETGYLYNVHSPVNPDILTQDQSKIATLNVK